MIDILRKPDDIRIICDEENTDAAVRIIIKDRKLSIWMKAEISRPQFICMRWNYRVTEPTKIMGDKWERSYGDMEWHSLNGEIFCRGIFWLTTEKKRLVAALWYSRTALSALHAIPLELRHGSMCGAAHAVSSLTAGNCLLQL